VKWLVIDRLYNREAYWCGHLDSYGHYLEAAGEEVRRIDLAGHLGKNRVDEPIDVVFALEGYDFALTVPAKKRIAQVACDLEVPRGFDAIVSSIPALVEKYRARGDSVRYMPLAFDTRARVCAMGVKRDLDCIFIGTVGPNHKRRGELLRELADIVTVLPPVFGRLYFRTLARARVVLNPHAEWACGVKNNMRSFEASGMSATVVTDAGPAPSFVPGRTFSNAAEAREIIGLSLRDDYGSLDTLETLARGTYESRVPDLISLARSL